MALAMSWSTHIQMVGNRAVKILKRNLTNCPTTIKRQAYLAHFRPIMEYIFPVWDPYFNSDIYKLERVQSKGVSCTYKLCGDLRPRGQSLDWKILLQHCIDQALASFIAKIFRCSLTVDFWKYFEWTVNFQFDRGRRSTHSVLLCATSPCKGEQHVGHYLITTENLVLHHYYHHSNGPLYISVICYLDYYSSIRSFNNRYQ